MEKLLVYDQPVCTEVLVMLCRLQHFTDHTEMLSCSVIWVMHNCVHVKIIPLLTEDNKLDFSRHSLVEGILLLNWNYKYECDETVLFVCQLYQEWRICKCEFFPK